jgi:DNA-binding NarL/FixJ family response regulator
MKRTLEREWSLTEAARTEPVARVVLVTADGVSIDVTHAADDLLYRARVAMPGERSAAPACPASWAALCKHLGRCDGRCAASSGVVASHTASNVIAYPASQLTDRESQVVAHVRQGFTNKEIARRLGIQEDTVKKHLQAVFGKLGVRRRALLALGGAVRQAPRAS